MMLDGSSVLLSVDMFTKEKTQLIAFGAFRMLPLVDFFMLKNLGCTDLGNGIKGDSAVE